jgi:dipeptidyl aminopeptidase/acylaminoacyl peptidase
MRYFFISFFFVIKSIIIFSQGLSHHFEKPPLDTSVYNKWPSVEGAALSNDGKYVSYTIRNQHGIASTLIIKSTAGDWSLEIPGAANGMITQDGRIIVFAKARDSVGIAILGTTLVEYIENVKSYKLSSNGKEEWLAYQLGNKDKEVVLRNLITKSEKLFSGVNSYLFGDSCKALILQMESKQDTVSEQSVQWVKLSNLASYKVWSDSRPGTRIGNIIFDKSNNQIAFKVSERNKGRITNSFWCYRGSNSVAFQLADGQTSRVDSSLELGEIWRFSFDGNGLFFYLREKEYINTEQNTIKLNVWSYSDAKLQSLQLKELAPKNYVAFIDINTKKIIRLEEDGQRIDLPYAPRSGNEADDFAILSERKGDPSESKWNKASQEAVYIESIKNGKKICISKTANSLSAFSCKISPGGRFMIYYDSKGRNYFSYEISSGLTRNITKDVVTNWTRYKDDNVNSSNSYYPIAGWLTNDSAVLLYDQYDIWKIDTRGHNAPINITNSYGHKHNIEFRFAIDEGAAISESNQNVLLVAYERDTKMNGFYSKPLNDKINPIRLTMGPYIYYVPNIRIDVHGIPPIKAKSANVYIVQRMNATESPNYFSTTNFRTFFPVSNVTPERDYNWLRTELHRWETFNSSFSQGVLYKPENFDFKRKYPIILYCYERLSDGLNAYIKPEASKGPLNIAWYVSNGYLVFTPDIYFEIGETGKSILNNVLSAVNYLSKLPFVDKTKIGVQGMSFGAFETNYLITNTKVFAAACSASGCSDFMSYYGQLYSGRSAQEKFEQGQYRVGATLWERTDLYLKNSPILGVNRVTTPLLMMHTTNDGAVPFGQAIELFTALRRLNKKVWLLEYNEGNHAVNGKSADDFSYRMSQFFDFYLKDLPPPKWMMEGVEAKFRSVKRGLELDTSYKRTKYRN